MQRPVPENQLEGVDRVLDKRVTLNPEGLRYDEYVDARAHATDRLCAGDVESTPVSRDQAQHVAQDPTRWADRRLASARARQVGTATDRRWGGSGSGDGRDHGRRSPGRTGARR